MTLTVTLTHSLFFQYLQLISADLDFSIQILKRLSTFKISNLMAMTFIPNPYPVYFHMVGFN